jgi:excisionase family DNA binding protein
MYKTKPSMPPKFLTRHEAAGLLRISDRTLYSLTKNGQVPYIRLGQRCVRYPVDELERWLKEQTIGGHVESGSVLAVPTPDSQKPSSS